MTETVEPVRLAGSVLSRSCHVCAFFHSKEEEYRVLMPFIKDGFEKGDRAFHVVDPNHRPDHLRRLEQEGIDVADAEAKGQLEVRRWQEAYIKDDHFDQYRMIDTIKEALDPAKKQPGKLTRLVANMEWALEDLPGVHDIVEYETRLNLRPAGVPRPGHLHLRPVPVRRQRGDRHHADAPDGHHRRHPAREPVLRPARRDAEGTEGAGGREGRHEPSGRHPGSRHGPSMDTSENATEENRRLRRTMRDLVALSTLPAVWTGLGPDGIARSLADVLLNTLSLDLIYVRLAGSAGEGVVEVVRSKHGPDAAHVEAVRAALAPLLRPDRAEPPATIPDPFGAGTLHVAVTRFGVGDDHGVLVAGSRSADFPTEQDRLLLGVGANQTAIVVQRRRAEEALRASERAVRPVHAAPARPGVDQGLAGALRLRQRRRRAGLPARRGTSLYGKTDEEVFPPETAAQFRENDRRALASGAGVQVIETLEHEDGVVHHSLVSKFPIPGPDGGAALVGGMAIDITDRMQMEEALKEADRRKDEFLAMLAHELRNPLAPIRNALHLMKQPGGDGRDVEADAGDDRAAGGRTWPGWSTTCWTSPASPGARSSCARSASTWPPVGAAGGRDGPPADRASAATS